MDDLSYLPLLSIHLEEHRRWQVPCNIHGMKRINQMLFRENVLLPLVICVILPGMAGAWWRHSHGDLRPQVETTISTTDACEVPVTILASNQYDR